MNNQTFLYYTFYIQYVNYLYDEIESSLYDQESGFDNHLIDKDF